MAAHALERTLELTDLRCFLEAQWARLLAGERVSAKLDRVEDPAERFEWFQECGQFGAVRHYAMPLRDGSRIRAVVHEGAGTVRFERDRFDPAAGVRSMLRHAWHDMKLARAAARCVAAFRLRPPR